MYSLNGLFLDNREKIYFHDQYIEIIGCEHLRHVPGQQWK
jgi:hypothetical protein